MFLIAVNLPLPEHGLQVLHPWPKDLLFLVDFEVLKSALIIKLFVDFH